MEGRRPSGQKVSDLAHCGCSSYGCIQRDPSAAVPDAPPAEKTPAESVAPTEESQPSGEVETLSDQKQKEACCIRSQDLLEFVLKGLPTTAVSALQKRYSGSPFGDRAAVDTLC